MKPIILRKSYVTLLELMISLALTTILLSTLSYFYQQVVYMNAEADKEQNRSFQKLYIENRLLNIFSKTVSSTDKSNDFHFFTGFDPGGLFKQGSPNLIFTFDNGVQLDKQMSYHVIGRLFLDKDNNLVLAKWPVQKRWKENETPPMAKEVILENVETLSFYFFVPPEKAPAEKKTTTFEIPPELKGQWPQEWKKEYRQLPALVRIEATHRNEKGELESLHYVLPLPHTEKPVVYEE